MLAQVKKRRAYLGDAWRIIKNPTAGVPVVAQRLMNPTSIHEDAGFNSWPSSVAQGSGVAMNCGVGCTYSLDPV